MTGLGACCYLKRAAARASARSSRPTRPCSAAPSPPSAARPRRASATRPPEELASEHNVSRQALDRGGRAPARPTSSRPCQRDHRAPRPSSCTAAGPDPVTAQRHRPGGRSTPWPATRAATRTRATALVARLTQHLPRRGRQRTPPSWSRSPGRYEFHNKGLDLLARRPAPGPRRPARAAASCSTSSCPRATPACAAEFLDREDRDLGRVRGPPGPLHPQPLRPRGRPGPASAAPSSASRTSPGRAGQASIQVPIYLEPARRLPRSSPYEAVLRADRPLAASLPITSRGATRRRRAWRSACRP